MRPFEAKPVPKAGPVMRLFGRKPKHAAPVEVNNVLAAASTLRDVRSDQIDEIATRYGVDVTSRYAGHLRDLYRSYLQHCLADKKVTAEEIDDLSHLKALFALSDQDVGTIHEELAGEIFGETLAGLLTDGRLSSEEQGFLQRLQEDLRLPEDIARRLYTEAAQARVQKYLDEVVEDERLSPEEERELNAIANSLGANITMDEATRGLLARFRTCWAVENADLPEVHTDINLQRGEKCWAVRSVEWLEPRTVTKRVRYAGPTARIRIAKGLYLSAGDVAVQPVKQEVLKPVDSGQLYLTNKRLIFVGSRKSTNIRLGRVLDFNPFSDGVEVVKDAGRSPFFKFSNDVSLFSLILARALKESGS